MDWAFTGSQKEISSHHRSRRWLTLTCLLAGGMMFTLAGCDSEAMIASSKSEQQTALRILGTDSAVLMRADIEHQMSLLQEWMPDADDMTAYMEEAFDEVEDRTGIRLDEDVHGIYMAMAQLEEESNIGMLVFLDYDAKEVVDRLDIEEQTRRVEVDWPVDAFVLGDGQEMAVAFAEGSLVMVARGESHLRTMLDRAYDESAPVVKDELLSMVSDHNSWMVARNVDAIIGQIDLSELDGSGAMLRPLVASVQHVGVGVDTDSDRMFMEILIDPVDAVDSDDLENLFSGVKALLRMQARDVEELANLVEGIEVGSDNGFVSLGIEVERSDIERLEEAIQAQMSTY